MEIENQNSSDGRDGATHLPANPNEGSSGNSNGEKDPNEPKRLGRNLKDAMLGGVLAGFADYLTIPVDLVLIRLFFLFVSFFTFPIAPVCYFVAWIVMPLAAGSEGLERDKGGRIVKFGCLGCMTALLFPLLVLGLLLVLPIRYASDLSALMSDPSFFACDDISWDIQYHPDIPQLVVGAFLAFVFPVFSLVVLSGREEIWGVPKKIAYLFVAFVFAAGAMMIVSALTIV